MTIIIFGAPGCGKGTQSALIVDKYHLKHISTGDILRAEMQNATPLGLRAKHFVESGQLVPDDLILDMLMKAMDCDGNTYNGCLLDGFPRTTAQAEALEKLLLERKQQTNVLIDLEVNDDELVRRMIQRGIETGRTDDKPETIRKRLDVFHSQTVPVRDFYQSLDKYVYIDGTESIETVFEHICKEIELHL